MAKRRPVLDHYLPDLGGQRKSDLLGYGGAYNSFNLNLYAYGHQNPLIYKDPDGNSVFKVMSIAFKVVVKGAKAADVVNGIIDDVQTLTSADSSMLDRGLAAFSLVSGVDAKYVKKALHVIDKAHDAKQAAQKAKTAQKAGHTCSFAPGTLVMTKEGLKPIGQIKAGDEVLARDEHASGEDSQAQTWKKVLVAYSSLHDDALELSFIDEKSGKTVETVIATAEHPFHVQGQGWKRADQLQSGERVATASGGWLKVGKATWIATTQLAYNMEVAGYHTYFVGRSGVWVHNECNWTPPATEGHHTIPKEGLQKSVC